MANQRKKSRNKLVGAYVTPDLKKRIMEAAKARGLSVADYIRFIVDENTKGIKNAQKG